MGALYADVWIHRLWEGTVPEEFSRTGGRGTSLASSAYSPVRLRKMLLVHTNKGDGMGFTASWSPRSMMEDGR